LTVWWRCTTRTKRGQCGSYRFSVSTANQLRSRCNRITYISAITSRKCWATFNFITTWPRKKYPYSIQR
jgi:hypothetical protein